MVKKEFLRFALLMSDSTSRDFINIIAKLIQVVLFKEEEFLTISEIIDKIDLNFGIPLSTNEVATSIKNNGDIFLTSSKEGKKAYCISSESKNKIGLIVGDKIFDKIIANFVKEHYSELSKIEMPNGDYKDIVFKCVVNFFYYQFNSNAQNLLKLLDKDYKWINENNNEELDFLTRRIALFFLEWNNAEKDIFVYNIINSSYEYCLISLKGNNAPFKSMFKSKKFVLDTNVILSLIGVNGNAKKKAAIKFLEKCKEFGIKMVYTNYTKQESYETIRKLTRLFNSGFADLEGKEINKMYCFQELYNEWLISPHFRKQHSSDFEAYVNKLLDSCLLDLQIEEIDSTFISNHKVDINVNIDSLRNKKEHISNKTRSVAVLNHDIVNYLFVLSNRPKNCVNVIDCKMLFVSFDRVLCNWCDEQNIGLPSPVVDADIIYSLLLRFSERSSDDFRSFNEFVGTSIMYLYDNKSALESKSIIAKAVNADSDFSNETKKKIYIKASEIIDKRIYVDEAIDTQDVLNIAIQHVYQEDKGIIVEELNKKHDEEIESAKSKMLDVGKKEGSESTIHALATIKTFQKVRWLKFFYGFIIVAFFLGGIVLITYGSIMIVKGGDKVTNVVIVILAILGILSTPIGLLVNAFFKNVLKKEINFFRIDEKKIFTKQYEKLKKQISNIKK